MLLHARGIRGTHNTPEADQEIGDVDTSVKIDIKIAKWEECWSFVHRAK